MKLKCTIKKKENKTIKYICGTAFVVIASVFLGKTILSSKLNEEETKENPKEKNLNKDAVKNLKFVQAKKKLKEYLDGRKNNF